MSALWNAKLAYFSAVLFKVRFKGSSDPRPLSAEKKESYNLQCMMIKYWQKRYPTQYAKYRYLYIYGIPVHNARCMHIQYNGSLYIYTYTSGANLHASG
jgi:hypothetical protein